jgi:hypothetical protein
MRTRLGARTGHVARLGTSIGHVARLAVTLGKGHRRRKLDRLPRAHVPSKDGGTLRGRAHGGGPLGARDARVRRAVAARVAAASAPSMAEAQRAKPTPHRPNRRFLPPAAPSHPPRLTPNERSQRTATSSDALPHVYATLGAAPSAGALAATSAGEGVGRELPEGAGHGWPAFSSRQDAELKTPPGHRFGGRRPIGKPGRVSGPPFPNAGALATRAPAEGAANEATTPERRGNAGPRRRRLTAG